MIQFLRLMKLSNTDAFLLESIFRKEVWDFMYQPVSEKNEEDVVNYVIDVCSKFITELESCKDDIASTSNIKHLCQMVRSLELRALQANKEYILRDREALDL